PRRVHRIFEPRPALARLRPHALAGVQRRRCARALHLPREVAVMPRHPPRKPMHLRHHLDQRIQYSHVLLLRDLFSCSSIASAPRLRAERLSRPKPREARSRESESLDRREHGGTLAQPSEEPLTLPSQPARLASWPCVLNPSLLLGLLLGLRLGPESPLPRAPRNPSQPVVHSAVRPCSSIASAPRLRAERLSRPKPREAPQQRCEIGSRPSISSKSVPVT